ncbi:MAG: TetR/AcrR family transcriptional regulator, partial [Rubrobacteraceae bacterium]
HSFIEAGVIEEMEDPGSVPRLAKVLMLVAEFWLPAAEINDGERERDLRREGVGLMMQVLAPYLTGEGAREAYQAGLGGERL